eukprot:Gb_23349 [translate_table: standard]
MAHWGSCSLVTRTRWVRPLRSNYGVECSKEWGAVYLLKQAGLCIEPHLCMTQNQWSAVHLALFRGGCLCWFNLEEKLARPAIMGGKPVTIQPSVLIVDEDVRSILEEAGILSFFKKFSGHSESITNQFIESWKDGRVMVSGTEITINEALIADVSGLPNEGEVVSRDKMIQVSQLTKFIKDDETFCWLDSGIARESLPKPWDRVAVQVMKYLTLEGKFRKLFGYHIAILNSMRNKEKISIPLFLYKSLEKSMHAIKTESSEEDQKSEDLESLGGRSSPPKVSAAAPSVKSEKSPTDSLFLSEELRCHLWVLNGLGGSLTSTCACINLLTLEITNYLKEVLKNMKEMKDIKE